MDGWIKLWRKTLRNPVLMGNSYCLSIFIILLLEAKDGKLTIGRKQIAGMLRAKEATIYKAMLRLRKGELINIESNNQFSTISICNWKKYQQQSNSKSNNKVTTKEQQSNTLKELRIKNREEDNTIVEIQRIYDLYLEKFNKNKNQYKLTDIRKKKIKVRLSDSGYELLSKAILNSSRSAFHRGDNDRGWQADLDFIIRSYEQVEKLANLKSNTIIASDGKVIPASTDLEKYEAYIKQEQEERRQYEAAIK